MANYFKQFAIERGCMDSKREYLIEEYNLGYIKCIDVYTKNNVIDTIKATMLDEGYYLEQELWTDIVLQVNKGFEYDKALYFKSL